MDGSPTEFSCDGSFASHGQGGQAVRTTNRLLCDIDIGPDGDVVEIGDVGAQRGMSTYVRAGFDFDGTDDLPRHALWVHTMNVHECDVVGRRVYVRVLSGSDAGGLGVLAFDGHLNIASGMAVRFEPGQQRTVELVDIGGDRQIYGFRGLVQGAL